MDVERDPASDERSRSCHPALHVGPGQRKPRSRVEADWLLKRIEPVQNDKVGRMEFFGHFSTDHFGAAIQKAKCHVAY